MWKYNETDNLPGNSLYHSTDELYHYGVLGMRWGHRKNSNVRAAHKEYKQAKREYRKASVKNIKNAFRKSSWASGVDNEKAYNKNHKELFKARDKREKSAFKLIDAAAKDAYNKKLAKTGSKSKAEKASMKVHIKAMNQNRYGAGRVGSNADKEKRHGVVEGNRHYYNHLVKSKGKKYANAVERKYNKKTTKKFIAAVGVAAGLAIANKYATGKAGTFDVDVSKLVR